MMTLRLLGEGTTRCISWCLKTYGWRAKPFMCCSAQSSHVIVFLWTLSFLRVWTHLRTCTKTWSFFVFSCEPSPSWRFPSFYLCFDCSDAAFLGGCGSCSYGESSKKTFNLKRWTYNMNPCCSSSGGLDGYIIVLLFPWYARSKRHRKQQPTNNNSNNNINLEKNGLWLLMGSPRCSRRSIPSGPVN